jgi:hypothetical protein
MESALTLKALQVSGFACLNAGVRLQSELELFCVSNASQLLDLWSLLLRYQSAP